MARRRLKSNEYREDRAVRQNRSTGQREDYRPWIEVGRNEFASQGITEFRPSVLFRRHQTVVSLLEIEALRVLQLLNPSDIREQFKLQHEGVEDEFLRDSPHATGSVEIAESLGLKHPIIRIGKPLTMSTDFLVNRRGAALLAVHVKYEKDLSDARNAELRRIESEYWRQRGAEFLVFTEKELNRTAKNNLILLECYHSDAPWRTNHRLHMEIAELAKRMSMLEVLTVIEKVRGIPTATTADVVKFAISTGRIRMDVSHVNLVWSNIWPPMQAVSYRVDDTVYFEGAEVVL